MDYFTLGSPVGEQQIWKKLLVDDYEKGVDFLELCMKYEDTANQITANKYAMRLIIANYTYTTEREEIRTVSDTISAAIDGIELIVPST